MEMKSDVFERSSLYFSLHAGDIFDLPSRFDLIDFAYAVIQKLGIAAEEQKVNGS